MVSFLHDRGMGYVAEGLGALLKRRKPYTDELSRTAR